MRRLPMKMEPASAASISWPGGNDMRGNRWGIEGPPEEAYSRVTNPERFQPLHAAATELLDRLEREFAVERLEGHDADDELGRESLARPPIRLVPHDPQAAPIVVAFTEFPGLYLRFGSWRTEPFPRLWLRRLRRNGRRVYQGDDQNGGSRRLRRVPRGNASASADGGWLAGVRVPV